MCHRPGRDSPTAQRGGEHQGVGLVGAAGEVAAQLVSDRPRSPKRVRLVDLDPTPMQVPSTEDNERLLRSNFDRVGSDLGHFAVGEVVKVAGRDV